VNENYSSSVLPIPLPELIELASSANARCRFPGDQEDQELRGYHSIRSIAQVSNEEPKPRTVNPFSTDQYDRPRTRSSLAWVRIGYCFIALFHPIMRKCYDTVSCNQRDVGDMLSGAATWRYLSMRFAQLCAERGVGLGRQEMDDANYLEASEAIASSLLRTAKLQRNFLNNLLHCDATELAGGSTTLAVKTQDSAFCRGFLVAVNDLGHLAETGSDFVVRTERALSQQNQQKVRHNILMLDSIDPRSNVNAVPRRISDHPIHLVGNSDEIRFVVVVSDVPDLLKGSLNPDEFYSGRFRLNKAHIRDVFLGQRYQTVFPMIERLDETADAANQVVDFHSRPPPITFNDQAADMESISDCDTLISSKQITRAFFSSKRLREFDPS
jgi:hypothetical protein